MEKGLVGIAAMTTMRSWAPNRHSVHLLLTRGLDDQQDPHVQLPFRPLVLIHHGLLVEGILCLQFREFNLTTYTA